MDLQDRIRSLIDDQLMAAYWESAKHFGSQDLVLVFVDDNSEHPLTAYTREAFLTTPDLPAPCKDALKKPASMTGDLKASDAAFWLMVLRTDGESGWAVVKAKKMAPEGHA